MTALVALAPGARRGRLGQARRRRRSYPCRSRGKASVRVLEALRADKPEIVTLPLARHLPPSRARARDFRAKMATATLRVERLKELGYAFTPMRCGLRALMAAEAVEHVVTEWLDAHWPGPTPTSRCAHCGPSRAPRRRSTPTDRRARPRAGPQELLGALARRAPANGCRGAAERWDRGGPSVK
jgi:hypothetical protein